MKLIFNPTGTKVHKERLKVRFDFIPDLSDKNAYKAHRVRVEGAWQVNPCLCMFVTVPETVGVADIGLWAEQKIIKEFPASLDNLWGMYLEGKLSMPLAHYTRVLCKGMGRYSTGKVVTANTRDLILSVNQKLSLVQPISLKSDGSPLIITPESIDVGADATIDRNTSWGLKNDVTFCLDNPANDTGTIDTVQIWIDSNAGEIVAGTLYDDSGNFTSRDHESLGAVTGGSVQTFDELDIDITTGDYIGASQIDAGTERYIERADSGGSGFHNLASTTFPFSNKSSDEYRANNLINLYGTGTEAAPSGSNVASIVAHMMAQQRRN